MKTVRPELKYASLVCRSPSSPQPLSALDSLSVVHAAGHVGFEIKAVRRGPVNPLSDSGDPMDVAINNLYSTFAHYRLGDDFTGCDCCVGPDHSARLATPALRELRYDDLERYSSKAISTWGNVRHFKYFLPRLLELTIEHRDEFLDLAVVFGKLRYAQFDSWPQRERDAVHRFLDEYWNYQLADPIVGVFEDSIDTVLCAISNALSSVQRLLDTWTGTRTDSAKRHFAAFILNNDDTLLKKRRLSNAFWDTSGQPHSEVVAWLQSDAVLGYFDGAGDNALVDEFSYAWPQLMALYLRSMMRIATSLRRCYRTLAMVGYMIFLDTSTNGSARRVSS